MQERDERGADHGDDWAVETPFNTRGIRGLLVHKDTSLSERLRRRRWRLIQQLFPDLSELSVLDLGGTGPWWGRAPVRPRAVTAINLFDSDQVHPAVRMVQGNVLDAEELVRGETFDLVFSNSLIEHLGGHAERRRFAQVVRTMAPRYIVQTPYRYFPIEPHWMFPGLQFLPTSWRFRLAPRWPLGHTRGFDQERAENEVMMTRLLDRTELQSYLPDARILFERVGGVPKSMLAVRTTGPAAE